MRLIIDFQMVEIPLSRHVLGHNSVISQESSGENVKQEIEKRGGAFNANPVRSRSKMGRFFHF